MHRGVVARLARVAAAGASSASDLGGSTDFSVEEVAQGSRLLGNPYSVRYVPL